MKLLFSPTSPYVRKCLVVAHELGLNGRLQLLPSNAHPINRDREIIASNPLGKVPTFFTDDGQVLYDSRVICEYLDTLAGGSLFPRTGPAARLLRTEGVPVACLQSGPMGAGGAASSGLFPQGPPRPGRKTRDGAQNRLGCRGPGGRHRVGGL